MKKETGKGPSLKKIIVIFTTPNNPANKALIQITLMLVNAQQC